MANVGVPPSFHLLGTSKVYNNYACQAAPLARPPAPSPRPTTGTVSPVPLASVNKRLLPFGLSIVSRSTPRPFVCAIVADGWLGHYNTILVFLIFLCVQIVHLPVIHLCFPLRAGYVPLTGTITPSVLQPDTFLDGLVSSLSHHGHRCRRHQNQGLTLGDRAVHRQTQEGL